MNSQRTNDEQPIMSFEHIEAVMGSALHDIEAQELPTALALEKCQLLIVGTLGEILRTLSAVHPNFEPKRILS